MFLVFEGHFVDEINLNNAVARCALPIYFKGGGPLLQKTLEVRILHWYENEFQNYLEVGPNNLRVRKVQKYARVVELPYALTSDNI